MEIVNFNNAWDVEEFLFKFLLVNIIGSGLQKNKHAFSENWKSGAADNDGEEIGAEGISNDGRGPDVDDDGGSDDTNTHEAVS